MGEKKLSKRKFKYTITHCFITNEHCIDSFVKMNDKGDKYLCNNCAMAFKKVFG